MSSLVSEFIINPVLRQARRFSEISRTTLVPEQDPSPGNSLAVSDSESPAPSRTAHAPAPVDLPPTRPVSASTLPATVDDDVAEPDHATFEPPSAPRLASPTTTMPQVEALPADDGMGALRKRLLVIQTQEISAEDKARLMHEVLMEGYRKSRVTPHQGDARVEAVPVGEQWQTVLPSGPLESLKFWQHPLGEPSSPEKFALTAEDVRPTYHPPRPAKNDEPEGPRVLGCEHYRRNVKLQCSTCHKWYTCRFCHDAAEDHTLVRKETKNMLCMRCACPQRASEVCVNCGVTAARYYCNICKLWDDHPDKNIYHCNDCGICRRGVGIGKDFFHCKTCCACISIAIQQSHKCIERSTDCDCPICGEYLFTSPKPVVFMGCGHSIHKKCYDQHMLSSYKCPLCNKSLLNMQSHFRQLELAILSQPMPPEFRDTRATVLCNDCSGRSSVPYHWLGLKCAICTSYNTVELQISGPRDGNTAAVRTAAQPPETREPAPVHILRVVPPALEVPATRAEAPTGGRRRHSSHAGAEARTAMLDRMARSASPGPVPGLPPNMAHTTIEEEQGEPDNIFNFWGRQYPEEDTDSSMSTDQDDEECDEEEDDEDDDENDFMLIGHR
ncbi:putative RING finger protein [Colletotrichum orbiculare MAFF 240422]|uniref:RING finger protein n=1 Tax=Colletotrichum orbiculare (strain 104-T / ATCC 96160 / CBS 514.97 / LARS 414 / MAFF 240422) TaxID=1213857 RepID=N4VCW6_COLOR|nr:putative RING finger protein [Colletotrichum orbiculare MAFF 240422]